MAGTEINWRQARWVGNWYTVVPNKWSAEASALRTVDCRARDNEPLPGQDSNKPWHQYEWTAERDLSADFEIDGWRLEVNGHQYFIYND